MADKTITTLLCPGGGVRMRQLMRLIQNGRLDPTKMTSHRFKFDQVAKALEMMETKEDGVLKPVILFD